MSQEVGSKLEGSYVMALNIWIVRFRKAQAVIRELEDENEQLRAELEACRLTEVDSPE